MAETLFALGDCGATQTRIAIADVNGFVHDVYRMATKPGDYEGSVQDIADYVETASSKRGRVEVISFAVAAELDSTGKLIKSGGLTPWVGKVLGADLAVATGMPEGLVGTMNDVVAIAKSQAKHNETNNIYLDGYATTLSSGWGGARYHESGEVEGDEPGHEQLRDGDICPCGQHGHAEAYISGNGIFGNKGVKMEEWLQNPLAVNSFVRDVSNAVIDLLHRHVEKDDFRPEEIRWTGGVALNHPFILMHRVHKNVRDMLGSLAPNFDTVTYGEQAGIHGTFIDALERAQAT